MARRAAVGQWKNGAAAALGVVFEDQQADGLLVQSVGAGDGGAFVVVDEDEQDLAAGSVGHGPAGGFDGVGDAAGGAVFDDVPARLVVADVDRRTPAGSPQPPPATATPR
ncbi:hypothetical protein [Streptomyces canus]|uniref:hypothetical protein n=1 Tax=Streptomyces canus TaxID=58343 RepID=UPI003827F80F